MKLNKLKTIILEDEIVVREALIETLEESLEFEVIGACGFAEDGIAMIIELRPDVVFMDIKLQGGDAFQVLQKLKNELTVQPAVIINTGHSEFEHAQRIHNDFNNCVVHILRKPFWNDWSSREDKVLSAISKYLRHQKRSKSDSFSFKGLKIRNGAQLLLVKPEEVNFLEVGAKGSGKTTLSTISGKIFTVNKTLVKITQDLPNFILPISRFTAINLHHVQSIDISERTVYLVSGDNFSIGENYYKELSEILDL